MKRVLQILASLIVTLPVVGLGSIKVLYGGGQPFPDRSTEPAVPTQDIASVALDMPPGCVAVSNTGRVFFDTHPFAAPERFGEPHVFELVDGKPVPWPDAASQDIFEAPFGLTVDSQDRLWFVEPATLDRSATRLLAFDLATDTLVYEATLPDGTGRFAQDLRVTPDGTHIVLADTGMLAITPGQLLVWDIEAKSLVRTFQHPTLNPEDHYIRRYDGAPHRILWGLVTFAVGVDGITFSEDGKWLTYATMTSGTLHRIPTAQLLDPAADIAVEVVSEKPQTDGIERGPDGSIVMADIENGGIARVHEGELQTLTKSQEVVWADSVAVAPDGEVWFTDSAIPAYYSQTTLPPSEETLAGAAPYRLYHFRPDWDLPEPEPVPCDPLPEIGSPCEVAQMCPIPDADDSYLECSEGEWRRITEFPADVVP